MRGNRTVLTIGGAVGMLLLILDGRTALLGMWAGIELCLKTVVPSLFPFFVLSTILTSSLLGTNAGVFGPFFKVCRIPSGAESVFLTGLLGGYPLGARTISDSCHSGQLSREDGKRMLAFCNNAGPAFIFGMAGTMFQEKWIPWALWGIHILGAVFTALVLPPNRYGAAKVKKAPPASLPAAVRSSIGAMANVCAWVVLFRVVIAFLDRWVLWLLPEIGQVLVYGLLELSNGCCALDRIANEGLRVILCSCLLAFGGVCVAMQTVSVAAEIDIGLYLPGKLVQTSFCVLLSCALQWSVPAIEQAEHSAVIMTGAFLSTVICVGFLRKLQKSSSIPEPVGV